MKVYCRSSKYIFDCRFEEREIPKLLKFKWSKVNKIWWKEPSILLLKVLEQKHKRYNFELDNSIYIFTDNMNKEILINSTKTELYKHQEVMATMILSQKRGIFKCGVGTGKTLASIAVICQTKLRTLVVCPHSIMPKWKNELTKNSDLSSVIVDGSLKKRVALLKENVDVYIVNYEILKKLELDIIKMNFNCIVLDEVHKVKSRTSIQSKSAFKICKPASYVIGMSGTVKANSNVDFFSQWKIVDSYLFGEDYYLFEDRYIVKGGYGNYQITGYRNEDELYNIMGKQLISYTLEEVAPYLPEAIDDVMEISIPDSIYFLIRTMKKERLLRINDKVILGDMPITRDLRINQLCSGFIGYKDEATEEKEIIELSNFRIDALFDKIEDIEGKVVIWCKYIHSIEKIVSRAKKEGIKYDTYYSGNHGDYSTFESGDKKLWIAQISTGIGYDLPSVVYSIFYELDYSHINQVQAKGRTRRLVGSEKEPRIYLYMLTKYEKHIYDVLKTKDYDSKDIDRYLNDNISLLT